MGTSLVHERAKFTIYAGTIDVEVPPHSVMMLKVGTDDYPMGYNRYDRIY